MNSLRFCLLSFICVGVVLDASAQKKEKPGNIVFGKAADLEIQLTPIPDAVGSGGKPAPSLDDPKASQEGRWLRIDVPFETSKKFTPEIKFKFYLEGYELVTPEEGGKAGKPEETFVILTGETTYRDIPEGKKHYAGMFLNPAATLRYAGKKTGGENDWSQLRMNLRVEAFEGGAPSDSFFDLHSSKNKGPSDRGGTEDPEWYKSTEGKEISGALLPLLDTPFWPKDYKRYPQPKRP